MKHYRHSQKLAALSTAENVCKSREFLSEKHRKIRLDHLPTEVLHSILGYLDTRALREVSRTNRRLFGLVDGASLVWSRTLWVEFGVRLRDL